MVDGFLERGSERPVAVGAPTRTIIAQKEAGPGEVLAEQRSLLARGAGEVELRER
jgi:hypothetical protein